MNKIFLAALLVTSTLAHLQRTDFNVVFTKISSTHISKNSETMKKVATETVTKFLYSPTITKSTLFDMQGLVNNYTDQAFQIADEFLLENNLDPMDIGEMQAEFNYDFIITYHGELDLTNGHLQYLSTLHRSGDVSIVFDDLLNLKYVELTLPIAFDKLLVSYDYNAEIMGIGPSGGIEGSVTDIKLQIKAGLDLESMLVTLKEFNIISAGSIDLEFTGNFLIDWLLNLLTEVVTTLFKKQILSLLEDLVGGAMDAATDEINQIIQGILHSASPAPAAYTRQSPKRIVDAILEWQK